MKAHDGMYIDGAWRPAASGETIDVVNPVDEQVIDRVPAGTAADVDTAVRAARAALPGWAATPPAERAAQLASLRDVLAARKDEIAETVTAELGSLVSFTGSTAVGRQIGATAGAAVKKVALELGGKSANVILPSADLAKAVNVGVANVMSNSGQTCSAWTRMLVHRDQYDEAVELAA